MDNAALPPVSSGVSVHNKSCDESIFCKADMRAAQMATHVVGDKAQVKSTESKNLPNNEGKRPEKRKSEKVKDSSKMHDTLRAMLDKFCRIKTLSTNLLGTLVTRLKFYGKTASLIRMNLIKTMIQSTKSLDMKNVNLNLPIKKLTEVALITKLALLTVVRGLILIMAVLMQCPVLVFRKVIIQILAHLLIF